MTSSRFNNLSNASISPPSADSSIPQNNRPFCGTSPASSNGGHTNASDSHMDEPQQQQHNQSTTGRLSDMNLASRKANEAAVRRYQAASWLQNMVGRLGLSSEPSEDEFRQCLKNGIVLCNLINLIHPGAVPKIVENHSFSTPQQEGAPLSAYQYFENVRNFLVAVEELNLPSFEASDLDEGALPTGLPVKVVDCLLSLKAYHEWQQAGGHGMWKIVGPLKPTLPSSKAAKAASGLLSQNRSKSNAHMSNGWGPDRIKDTFEELGDQYGMTALQRLWKGQISVEELGNEWSSLDSSAGWVHNVCHKFVEFYLTRRETSTNDVQDMCLPCEPLLRMIMMVLHDKEAEEVSLFVEFMLKRVIEESRQRFLGQVGQNGLAEPNARLRRSQSNVLEDSVMVEDRKYSLQKEIRRLQSIDQQRAQQLDLQRNELQELRFALESMRLECQDAQLGWEEEMEGLNVKLEGLAQAAAEYHRVAAENRELYNQVQDLRGNIRVYCRVRPFLSGQNSSRSTVDFIGEKGSITIANPTKLGKEHCKSFTFKKVFGPSARQDEVFLDTQPLIRSVLDGYNVCIFAYGQTGSGKTYTMSGPNNPSPKDWGVNFRALHDLFELAQYRKDLVNYEIGVQMIEIYNEQVRDLLCADGSNKKLEIRNSSQPNGLNVPDASMVPVNSTEDVLDLMKLGHKNRAVGSTALNDRSSRSHSVLTVHIKGKELSSGTVLRGCLHLVDLAGSERVDKSEATGDRLKEAQHINKSLSALGDVIAALAQKNVHVPYRNSKLTQLLQDSLGGQAKTLMFVHISPDAESFLETISTLKFAERVAMVELGAAQSNKESADVRELKDQVSLLKEALAKKDIELERSLKEARSKAFNNSSGEKLRVKAHHDHGPVHGQSNSRLPLEEVRRVHNFDSGSELNAMQSPPFEHHASFYNSRPHEESGKRKASSKLPRGPMVSPPHVANHGMSKNKIGLNHYTDEDTRHHELHDPGLMPPHDKLTIRSGRNGIISNGHGLHDGHGQGRQPNGHGHPTKSPTSSICPVSHSAYNTSATTPDFKKDFQVHHHRSRSYSYADSGDCSTEGSPGRRDFEFDEYEEDEGTSYSSEAEMRWQKETESPCSSRGEGCYNVLMEQEKGGCEGDKRSALSQHKHGSSPNVKKMDSSNGVHMESPNGGGGKLGGSLGNAQQARLHSQRFYVESKKTRGKPIPVSPERSAMDCPSKARVAHPPPKRWV